MTAVGMIELYLTALGKRKSLGGCLMCFDLSHFRFRFPTTLDFLLSDDSPVAVGASLLQAEYEADYFSASGAALAFSFDAVGLSGEMNMIIERPSIAGALSTVPFSAHACSNFFRSSVPSSECVI